MTRAWGFTRLTLIAVLAAVVPPLIAAPGAQADVMSCATDGGMAPIVPRVQAVIPDLATTGADSLLGDPLTDTDNGVREPNAGWEDGDYEFHDANSACLTVDTNGPADDGTVDTGLYRADIDSYGTYDNTVCGTGLAIDRGLWDFTTVYLTPVAALGFGEHIVDANYRFTFAAGTGPIVISSATTRGGETVSGGGVMHITPAVGNCITTDVVWFDMTGAFIVAG